jgi:hypothetical protein
MRIAIVLCGNLRTFLMPTREDPSSRLSDVFQKYIVGKNNADVFAFASTNDFFFDGVQYFTTDNKIEVSNNDTNRLMENIKFIRGEEAKILITEQLMSLLGDSLKALEIEDSFDVSTDPKYLSLKELKTTGNNLSFAIQQVRRLKLAYALLQKYESDNNFRYDIIIKWRFDNSVNGELDIQSYNLESTDIYVPGIHSPIIYDWFAYGKRSAMDLCLNLYDFFGSFIELMGRSFICSKCKYYGGDGHSCQEGSQLYDISLSVEHSLFRTLKLNNVKLSNSTYSSSPYRYKITNDNIPINDYMNRLNINATVINYGPGNEISETQYSKV